MSWYEFDEKAIMNCSCGWSGPASGNLEIFKHCFACECPECGKSLAVFSYPTIEETRRKAAEGNEKAKAELASALRRESFMERAKASELVSPSSLPDLEGDEIVVEWDILDPADDRVDHWTVLRHEGREIWREIAYYEGIARFREVTGVLREKYGRRLVEVRPSESSKLYLFGDDLWASDSVRHLNENLLRLHREPTGR